MAKRTFLSKKERVEVQRERWGGGQLLLSEQGFRGAVDACNHHQIPIHLNKGKVYIGEFIKQILELHSKIKKTWPDRSWGEVNALQR